ncbi:MAG: OmpP1/FadL family transporter [Adhaeribacter sp.]
MSLKLLSLLAGALLTSSVAQASGFQVNLQGQKQIGMGHAGTGLALDQASIFFNPGALSHLRSNGFMVGVSPLFSRTSYLEPQPGNTRAETDNPMGTPAQFYASYGAAESPLRFGLGVYTPFGSSVNWGNTWQGRFGLNELTLQTIFFQPTISYRITDKIGFGAGFVYGIGTVNLQRSIPLESSTGEGHAELDGKANGIGFNAGLFVQATDQLSLGLSYRSKVDMEVKDGDATFSTPTADPIAARFPNTSFGAVLPLPTNITLGLGFKASDKLTLAADLQFVEWSAYKSLRFDYGAQVNGSNFTESPRNYKDSFAYRFGAQYQATEKLALRAGMYYDQTPVQDGYLTPETPDADAIGSSLGLSYQLGERFGFDASFLYLNRKQRSDKADLSGGVPGTFKSVGFIPGFAFSYQF